MVRLSSFAAMKESIKEKAGQTKHFFKKKTKHLKALQEVREEKAKS